jgi:hypothetical protein
MKPDLPNDPKAVSDSDERSPDAADSWSPSSRVLGGGFMFVCGLLFSGILGLMAPDLANSRNAGLYLLRVIMLLALLFGSIFGFAAALAAVRNQFSSFRGYALAFFIALLVFSFPVFVSRVSQ